MVWTHNRFAGKAGITAKRVVRACRGRLARVGLAAMLGFRATLKAVFASGMIVGRQRPQTAIEDGTSAAPLWKVATPPDDVAGSWPRHASANSNDAEAWHPAPAYPRRFVICGLRNVWRVAGRLLLAGAFGRLTASDAGQKAIRLGQNRSKHDSIRAKPIEIECNSGKTDRKMIEIGQNSAGWQLLSHYMKGVYDFDLSR